MPKKASEQMEKTPTKPKDSTVRVPKDLHKRLKVYAAVHGLGIDELAAKLVKLAFQHLDKEIHHIENDQSVVSLSRRICEQAESIINLTDRLLGERKRVEGEKSGEDKDERNIKKRATDA